jgi:5-(carboxyamino)imidazole ribonucleotide synthase
VNLIGEEPDLSSLLAAVPDAHVHLYGKPARPGRKLGHVTVLAGDPGTRNRKVLQVTPFSPDVSPTWPT